MDKLVVPIPSNGFPLNNDDIRFFLGLAPYSKGVYQALEGILKAYGNNLIVSGCGATGSAIAEGWVILDGELIKVDAHTATNNYFVKVTTYNSAGNKQTQTGSTVDAYEQNRATATATSGRLISPTAGTPVKLGKEFTLALIRSDSDFEASTSNKGVIEKATTAEAQAGTADKYLDAALLQDVTSTETRKGIVEKSTNAEGKAGTADKNITADVFQGLKATNADVLAGTETAEWVSPAGLAAKDGGLLTKTITIGDWNMDSTNAVAVLHGVDQAKIREVSVVIRDDTNTLYYTLASMYYLISTAYNGGGVYSITSTEIALSRAVSGFFDATGFDSTSYNRGWVTIRYIP